MKVSGAWFFYLAYFRSYYSLLLVHYYRIGTLTNFFKFTYKELWRLDRTTSMIINPPPCCITHFDPCRPHLQVLVPIVQFHLHPSPLLANIEPRCVKTLGKLDYRNHSFLLTIHIHHLHYLLWSYFRTLLRTYTFMIMALTLCS